MIIVIALSAFLALAHAQTRILPLGDSITFGCGSSDALPPKWQVSCGASAGGYRAPLYHMLRDTGFSDSTGNATFTMVGTQRNGPSDIPSAQTSNEGHPGWTIPEINAISEKWVPLESDFILVHLGTNDCGQGHNTSAMLADMVTLLATIKAGNPTATSLIASVINFGWNSMPAACMGFNAALPALIATAAGSGQKVMYVDMNNRSNWCNGPKEGWPCTGVHPTTGGCE